jgi:hypothetical protein
MSWMAAGAAAIGLVTGAGGAFLEGRANDLKKKKLKSIANTPGVDVDLLTGEALINQQKHLPAASALSRDEATTRQQLVNDLLEQSLPGFTKTRDKALSFVNDYFDNPFSAEDLKSAQNNSAVWALGSGLGGSGMHQAKLGGDLYDRAQKRKQIGIDWLSALRGLSPTVSPNNALGLAGPDANSLISLRDKDRTQRMNIELQRAGIGGQTAAWAKFMQNQGAMLEGAGLAGLTGGAGGGMGGGMGGAPQANQWLDTGGGNWSARGGSIGPGATVPYGAQGNPWGPW